MHDIGELVPYTSFLKAYPKLERPFFKDSNENLVIKFPF